MASKVAQTPRTKNSRSQAKPCQERIRPDLCDAPRAQMTANVRPMLATLVDKPFDRPGWIFEIKWDGYRIMAQLDNGQVRLYSRNGLPFTGRYPAVAAALAKIPRRAVLDGEVVVLDANGYSDFEALQNYRGH